MLTCSSLISQFIASINKMVAAYDQGAQKDQHRVTDVWKYASLLNNKLDELESKRTADLASSSA